MSRTPTDRTAAWANWRARLDGAEIAIAVDVPDCGYYRARRFGRWAGVCIDIIQEIDPETGELVADEELAAWWGDGKRDDPQRLWSYCADAPITAAEFQRLQNMPAVTDLVSQTIMPSRRQ